MSRQSRGLNLVEPQEPHQACSGKHLPLPLPYGVIHITFSYVTETCFLLDTCLVSEDQITKHISDLQFLMSLRNVQLPVFMFGCTHFALRGRCKMCTVAYGQKAVHDDTFYLYVVILRRKIDYFHN